MNLFDRLFGHLPRTTRRILERDLAMRAIAKGPKRPRKPPESGLAVPAVPPRKPLPLVGGAEAPLEFDRD